MRTGTKREREQEQEREKEAGRRRGIEREPIFGATQPRWIKRVVLCCSVLQCVAVRCEEVNTLRHSATNCNTVQHTIQTRHDMPRWQIRCVYMYTYMCVS